MPAKLLVLEAALLEQVGDGRGEGEREERDAEEVADDVERQERAAQARLVVDAAPTKRDASRNASACGATNAPTTSMR